MENIKIPPHSEDAERALIGSILLSADSDEIIADTEERFFYKFRLRNIFRKIKEFSSRGEKVEPLLICEQLPDDEKAEIISCMGDCPSITGARKYLEIVRGYSQMRELLDAGLSISNEAQNARADFSGVIESAEKKIMAISEKERTGKTKKISEVISPLIEDIEQANVHGVKIKGVQTGFAALDMATGGLMPGNLIILAARPSVGKTAFMLNVCANAAIRNKKTVAIFSLEMSEQEVALRLLSSETGLSMMGLKYGEFARDSWQEIMKSSEKISHSEIYIDDSSSVSAILKIRSAIRRICNTLATKNKKLDLVAIDYLQLIRGTKKNPESRNLEVGEVSWLCKAMAKDFNVPILLLSQLNRAVEHRQDNRPHLADLRDSGSIEQDADMVLLLYREGMYKRKEQFTDDEWMDLQSKATLILAKQRNGPTTDIHLRFNKQTTTFTEDTYGSIV